MTQSFRHLCVLTALSLFAVPSLGFGTTNDTRRASYSVLSHSVRIESNREHLPDKCGLPVLSEAIHNRATLSEPAGAALRSMLLRPSLDTSIRVGNYRIHYDTTGENEPAMLDASHQRIPGSYKQYVDSVAAVLMYTASFETNVLGYLPPPPDNGFGGGTEYDVYILELGGSYYGRTTPETPINNKPDGGTFTTFLEIDNDFSFVFPDSNKGMPALRVTLAHELHHAIQIGNYGYWSGDVFFYEMTSVWIEDVVFTEVNDYYQYLRTSQGQFRRPDITFTSNDFIIYSRGIWGHFIAKRYGRDVMRSAWDSIRAVRPLQAMDNALQADSSSFRFAFAEWAKWNFFTGSRADTVLYYPEGRSYPMMVQSGAEFVPPTGAIEGLLPPLASRYYEVLSSRSTFTLAPSNINFDAARLGSTSLYPYRYLMNSQRIDDSYRRIADGVYVKLDVQDPTNWYDWSLGSSVSTGVPFPNPFLVDGNTSSYVAVGSLVPVDGTLSIFTSSMDLVFSSLMQTIKHLSGRQVFVWNGRTNNGEIARTGVYFFVLETQGQTITGKFAVVRK